MNDSTTAPTTITQDTRIDDEVTAAMVALTNLNEAIVLTQVGEEARVDMVAYYREYRAALAGIRTVVSEMEDALDAWGSANITWDELWTLTDISGGGLPA